MSSISWTTIIWYICKLYNIRSHVTYMHTYFEVASLSASSSRLYAITKAMCYSSFNLISTVGEKNFINKYWNWFILPKNFIFCSLCFFHSEPLLLFLDILFTTYLTYWYVVSFLKSENISCVLIWSTQVHSTLLNI